MSRWCFSKPRAIVIPPVGFAGALTTGRWLLGKDSPLLVVVTSINRNAGTPTTVTGICPLGLAGWDPSAGSHNLLVYVAAGAEVYRHRGASYDRNRGMPPLD